MSGRPPKPSSATSGLQEACVRELVGNYTGMEILHPIVADMSKDRKFKGMFWKVLSHEYEVISKRSQDLAQWEITAAQKAFKILMEGGNENGAVELYCDEILGLRCKLGAEWSQMMASILQTRDHIMGKFYGTQSLLKYENVKYGFISSPNTFAQHHPPNDHALPFTSPKYLEKGASISLDSANEGQYSKNVPDSGDIKMKRLIAMYRNAKLEFEKAFPKSVTRTSAAKFLRDTIENCLVCIASTKQSSKQGYSSRSSHESFDGVTISELEAVLKETTEIAVQGSGGKKRSFDNDIDESPLKASKSRISNGRPLVNTTNLPHWRTAMNSTEPPTASDPSESRKVPAKHHWAQRNILASARRHASPLRMQRRLHSRQKYNEDPMTRSRYADRRIRDFFGHSDYYRPVYR